MSNKKSNNKVNTNYEILNIIRNDRKENETMDEFARRWGVSREVMNGYLLGYWKIPAPAIVANIFSQHKELIPVYEQHLINENGSNGNGNSH